jgi:hypothetical protein
MGAGQQEMHFCPGASEEGRLQRSTAGANVRQANLTNLPKLLIVTIILVRPREPISFEPVRS